MRQDTGGNSNVTWTFYQKNGKNVLNVILSKTQIQLQSHTLQPQQIKKKPPPSVFSLSLYHKNHK